MSIGLIDLAGEFFYQMFGIGGKGYLITLALFTIMVILLLLIRATKVVILIVMIPLLTVAFKYQSIYFNFPPYILLVVFMLMGLIFVPIFFWIVGGGG